MPISVEMCLQVQIEPHRGRHAAALLPGQVGPKYTGLIQAVRTIVREEGIQLSANLPLLHRHLPSRPLKAHGASPDALSVESSMLYRS